MKKQTILITGAGSGFAKDAAFELAKKGYDVIATVEIMSQVSVLEQEIQEKKLKLKVEKLDVTNVEDRIRAAEWKPDILINNAGISEGGAVIDIPEENLRRQYEINVFGPIMLTQLIARQMVKRKSGRIIFISSVAGLSTDPFAGAYSSSKHSIEALAEAMYKELREYNIKIQTINPGPYLTGFNDRMFESHKYWNKNPKENVFDYNKIAFPHAQYNPDEVVKKIIEVVTEKTDNYRNALPKSAVDDTKKEQTEKWTRKASEDLGKRHEAVATALKMKPGTKIKGF